MPPNNCDSAGKNCTRQEAYENCIARAVYTAGLGYFNRNHCTAVPAPKYYHLEACWGSGTGAGKCQAGAISNYWFYWAAECPVGVEWNDATKRCGTGCEGKPDLPNQSWTGDGGACVDGCMYAPLIGAGVPAGRVQLIEGVRHNWGTLAVAGATCTAGEETSLTPHDPNKPVCVATGNGFSECVEPSGRHCVTGSQGGRYCWEPGQSGPRSNSQGTEGASKTPEGQTAQKPPNMPDATGTQGATTTINNTTTTTTTWVGSGGTPGQGNVGEGGRDSGTGEGDGEGDGPGSVGAGVGGLYESDGKTVESVYNDFKARVEGSPIRGAVAGFFATPSGGGCPTFTLPASTFWEANTFDHHCSGQLSTVLAWMGYLVLAVAGFFAVRIAIE